MLVKSIVMSTAAAFLGPTIGVALSSWQTAIGVGRQHRPQWSLEKD